VRYRWVAVIAATPPTGCALPPQETPAEALARRQLSCTEAGFQEGTPDFRLCVLLQQTNERLENVERRLGWIEQDVRFPPPYAGWPYWW
jgi:hypothetical protein